jgi:hypothetical protein
MSLPVVTECVPTTNGLSKLDRMKPGRRIVLDTIEDQWEWNDVEDIADQDARVTYRPKSAHT